MIHARSKYAKFLAILMTLKSDTILDIVSHCGKCNKKGVINIVYKLKNNDDGIYINYLDSFTVIIVIVLGLVML